MRFNQYIKIVLAAGIVAILTGCESDSRAVLLPLEYPDGTPVQSAAGDPVMAGYQTYGAPFHANATALYENAAPTSCLTCARLGAVVSEPSVMRQATGLLGASTVGAGAVMGGYGMMNYGNAAEEGKLGTNVNQNVSNSSSNSVSQHRPDGYFDHDHQDYMQW